ncbi:MAG: hypothetical protein KGK07_14615 [Chloroflexota bacterium]|nr:hypothetical protein [Chloroflexota bacterium]
MALRKPTGREPARTLSRRRSGDQTLAERIAALGEGIPEDERRRHPSDFSRNYHHYMHGHAKQDRD